MTERLFAEVVVVGAGPAGIAAAIHASESGRSVLLLDASPRPGGQIYRHHGAPPVAARPWLERLARSGARVLAQATVIDSPSPRVLLVDRPGRPALVGWDALVLATGARELFLPFAGWTLPGVVGAGAVQALRESGARFAGLRVVVAGTGPLLLAAAAGLRQAGARLVGVVEQAPWTRLAGFGAGLVERPRKLAQALDFAARLRRVPFAAGAWVVEASGRERVERVRVVSRRREWAWDCDLLACGFGLVPNLELPLLLGCDTEEDRVRTDERQQTSVASVFAAGELCGIAGVDQALATGAIAGLAAAAAKVPSRLLRQRRREQRFARRLARAFALRAELRSLAPPQTVVCRCEDVTLERLAAAGPSGRRVAARQTTREAKLHTRAGMGACQGRVCGPALRFLFGWEPDTIRPPLVPAALETLCAAAPETASPDEARFTGEHALEDQP